MIELQANMELKDTIMVGFKPAKQVYQCVAKENGANTSGKKKQAGVTRQKVSNSNPFDSLNTVENNDDLGFMASASLKHGSESGYGTQSLLEQWRETKVDDDYDL
ncbi:hypothetical protein Tco_0697977 [Tanacetum coccineum]